MVVVLTVNYVYMTREQSERGSKNKEMSCTEKGHVRDKGHCFQLSYINNLNIKIV